MPPVTLGENGGPNQGTPSLSANTAGLWLTVGGSSSWSYPGGASFTYNGSAQTPTINFSGSIGARTTNYLGTANGGASYGPSATAPTGAGSYTVTNTVAGDANYVGITNGVAFTITRASSSISPTIGTYTYNGLPQGPNTATKSGSSGAITYNYTGTANGGGTYAASSTPPTLAGSYTVTASVAQDNNYNSASSSATAFTINQAATFVGASSSKNPSGFTDNVSFQATLPVYATGSVVFSSTNGPISTNNVSSGAATSLSITNLSRGTNVIILAYLGDGNYFGSTNNTLLQIVTNHPPVASVLTVTRTAGLALIIPLANIATNWSDADGDTVELTGVTMYSTNGINLMALNWTTNLDGSIVPTNAYAYLGYTNSPNVPDQISYSISDGQGGTNIGYVRIVSQSSVTGTNSITTYNFTSPNSNTITAYGIPGYSYILERATNLTSPIWVDLQTNQAATHGVINATDTFRDLGGSKPSPAFYQLKWQP